MRKFKKIINFLMKLNLLKTFRYSSFLNSTKLVLFYNKNTIKIHRTANIIVNKGNLHFFSSRYREPFVSMLEMQQKARIIANGTFVIYSGGHIIVAENATLELGNNSYVNRHCRIKVYQHLTIGDNCAISENVTIWDSDVHE
mgnify:CR=1 FL=1